MSGYFGQADLERAVGGADQLRQLLDKDEDDVADADWVTQVIAAGTSEMASYIGVEIAMTLTSPYAPILVIKSAEVGAFYAWKYGAGGQPIPEHIVQGHEAAVRWGQDVGARRATLGVDPKPALDPPAKMVDPDPYGAGLSVAGFKKGFR